MKKEEKDTYYCGNENCDYSTLWGIEEYREKGSPVCPYCGSDMYRAVDEKGKEV